MKCIRSPEAALELVADVIKGLRSDNDRLRAEISRATRPPNDDEITKLFGMMLPGEGIHQNKTDWSYLFGPSSFRRPLHGPNALDVLRQVGEERGVYELSG